MTNPGMRSLSFDSLDDTEFEQFCFDLLYELGFVNVDWRKGTGLKSSPADRGRDIVAQWEREEVDGTKHFKTWFVDCKHYKRGVPPERLQGLLAWAEAERPYATLWIASNFLSNGSKDYLRQYEETRRPPFKLRYWERPTLERLTLNRDALLAKYLVADEGIRSLNEIVTAEQEFFDRVWYDRKLMLQARIEEGAKVDPTIWQRAQEVMAEVVERYGADQLGSYTEFEWGMINGKLSALRWVMGDDWDNLDT
jgi:hypothetical protein